MATLLARVCIRNKTVVVTLFHTLCMLWVLSWHAHFFFFLELTRWLVSLAGGD